MEAEQPFTTLTQDTIVKWAAEHSGKVVAFRTDANLFGSPDGFYRIGGERFGYITTVPIGIAPMTEVFQLNFFLLSTNTTRMGGVPLLGYVLLSWNPEDLRALDQEESPSIPCTFDVREATVAERAALEAAVWDGHAKMQGDE